MGTRTFSEVEKVGARTSSGLCNREASSFFNRQIPQNPAWVPGKFWTVPNHSNNQVSATHKMIPDCHSLSQVAGPGPTGTKIEVSVINPEQKGHPGKDTFPGLDYETIRLESGQSEIFGLNQRLVSLPLGPVEKG